MTDLNKIIDQLSGLTILEASELVKQLEEKWGVSAAAPVAMAAAPATDAPAADEKTEFTVKLADAGASKINVIKAVKEIVGLGLAESKAIVEECKVMKEGVSKEEAESIKKKIEEAGGKVEVK
jgi:large subunit ribosomal protein L7/L12